MDGIPTVFMEAMATGRPVVSCAVSGIPELVRDGETGLIVSPDDPTALVKAVTGLLDDPERAVRIARHARAEVEKYTWARVRELWASLYSERAA